MSQLIVKHFMEDCPQPMNISTCINDLMSEVGELAKEINIATLWARETDYQFRPNANKELGQVLFMVYQLAEQMGMSADYELERVVDEFKERYARQGHTGSSTYLVGVQ